MGSVYESAKTSILSCMGVKPGEKFFNPHRYGKARTCGRICQSRQ